MKHLNKTRWIIIILIIFLAACEKNDNQDSSDFLNDYIGTWEGEGSQSCCSWTIRIVIGESEYNIEYPSIPCSGTLTLLEKSDDQLLFREKINSGSSCVDNGLVELTRSSGNKLNYKWYYSPTGNEKGELGATGVVVKQ